MKARILLASILTISLLAACGRVSLLPSATPPPSLPTATTLLPTSTSTPHLPPSVLHIWLPPRFNPAHNPLLQARLDAFSQVHSGLQIDVRIKEETGPASAFESLTLAYAAAPAALPDLVALSRTDLVQAAQSSVIQPIDGLTAALEIPGWSQSARALSHVQNVSYGFPFALDALVLGSSGRDSVQSWMDVTGAGPLAFNVNDAHLLLALYLAAGGTLVNDQGKPALDKATLTRALALFEQKTILMPVESDDLAWQSLQRQGGGFAVGWATGLLARKQAGVQVEALPGFEDTPATLVTGWAWAVASLDVSRQRLAVELADWLTADDFIHSWDDSIGFLPPRSDPRWDAVLQNARVMPSDDVLTAILPVLQQAQADVLRGVTADTAAQTAVGQLK